MWGHAPRAQAQHLHFRGNSGSNSRVEAARTNLFLQSQTINTGANWVPTRASVSTNATTSPDGTATAEKLVEDGTAANTHFVTQAVTFVSGTTYCISIWAKAGERSWVQLELGAAAFTSATSAYFDLANGVVGTTANSPTTFMQQYPNGWWRIGIIKTATASSGANCNFYLATGDGGRSYSGDSASGLSLYGSQCEAGSFPSSYIPTTTGSVARTADSCIRTLGLEFSATAGTVVVQGRASGGQDAANAQAVWEFNDGTASNRIVQLRTAAGDLARYSVFVAGAQQGPLDGTFINSTAFKSGIAWSANDLAYSHNGAAATTDATATIPAITKLEIGCATVGFVQMNGHIRRFDYYPARLPNADLVRLAA